MNDARLWAINQLQNILVGGQQNSTAPTNRQDTAFVNMVTLTALRHLNHISKIIKKLTQKNLSSQKPLVRMILILGTTELLYMNSADYGVINSYVEIAKAKTNHFAAGFINAVLRKINGQKEMLINDDKKDFFPPEFRNLLLKSYAQTTVDEIEKASLNEPALDITLIDKNSTIDNLGEILPLGTLRMAHKGKIDELPDYKDGKWLVQDFSSALPVKMLGEINGKKVLDVCAAPGGKTAQLLAKGAKVTALDISSARLDILQTNLQRLHLQADNIICADACEYLKDSAETYDIVLLDAPCSATGTLRRHPEIVYNKNAEDVKKQADLQKKLLELAYLKVAHNGCLAYCTCSLCKEEGENQIQEFLHRHSDWQIHNLAHLIPNEIAEIAAPEGWIRVIPSHLAKFGGADGFFVALLHRKA